MQCPCLVGVALPVTLAVHLLVPPLAASVAELRGRKRTRTRTGTRTPPAGVTRHSRPSLVPLSSLSRPGMLYQQGRASQRENLAAQFPRFAK